MTIWKVSSSSGEAKINIQTDIVSDPAFGQPPRAHGEVSLSVKARSGETHINKFRQAGSLKMLFPRGNSARKQAVLVNTAGGITGGDQFSVAAIAEERTQLVLTTQAAERAYRAIGEVPGKLTSRLRAEDGARLEWLPQETILFNGCNLQRSLKIDLAETAELLLVEPLIFGRAAMGEIADAVSFQDRIEITRVGRPYFCDAMRFSGDARAHLDQPNIAAGARAMAFVLFSSPRAEAALPEIRAALPEMAGASLIGPDLLATRILASDGFELRQSLVPILNHLTYDDLPRPWMI